MARGIVQISEVANAIIDPVLARRAGITTALIGSWEDIAGSDFADCTRPEKIAWARRAAGETLEAGGIQPAVLTIACEGARALFLAHSQSELLARINGFFGYPAIGQIRIVQKPVSPPAPKRARIRPLASQEESHLMEQVSGIESDELKAALARLGRAVIGSKARR